MNEQYDQSLDLCNYEEPYIVFLDNIKFCLLYPYVITVFACELDAILFGRCMKSEASTPNHRHYRLPGIMIMLP